ncbi:MAG: bifunctional (p)ppGpp synthetase/guanosine-3',5'-bis(diphosphate) 3'-pyrophosphohydrolase [Kofleriaceae bacterium]|nr:bifunctional (p)ppGpp synthetase/guanosine-3',5'-bis(diphosphate) 3'-pyrophosphohydrolase [Kofleriaceae bacterium]
MFSPDRYVETMRFAAAAHNAQKEPGHDLPYLVHVVSVAAEVIAALPTTQLANPELAVTCALLHDTVEDTPVTLDEVRARYGDAVAAGVAALTKNTSLPKPEQMPDSLRRIREQPPEIAVVKLADRITNLSAPPHYWSKEKCAAYRLEAITIADALGYASATLDARLRAKIEAYRAFC